MPSTILFVDEERFIHKALKRSFRNLRKEWQMHFADSPADALHILDEQPVEVVVSETMFTGQDGLDFLAAVREQYPQSARIILSGYADRDIVLKTVDLAHQYLAKPCDDDELRATIRRALMVKALMSQSAMVEVVSRIKALPTLPAVYARLVAELNEEDASIDTIGEIIAQDIGLTVKVLKMINSSFFGLRQEITHPAKAVSMLGIDLIKAIVLTSGTFDKFKAVRFTGPSLEQMWQHAMLTGAYAKIIAKQIGLGRQDADATYMAGLLHDIGKLLIAAYLPESAAAINAMVEQQAIPMYEAETAILGTTHSGIGAYLLGLWGLPDIILDAVTRHHTPGEHPGEAIDSTTIVHAANAFAVCGDTIGDHHAALTALDYAYFESAGLMDDVAHWKVECAQFAKDSMMQ